MASRVGAERGVAHSTGVLHSMAIGAGWIKNQVVDRDPISVEVAFRLWTGADLDLGQEITLFLDHGNRVAEVAFQSDGLFFWIEMLAVVAAQTTRRVLMADIIRVRGPIRLLLRVNAVLIGSFQL